jgi:hypothetical protein
MVPRRQILGRLNTKFKNLERRKGLLRIYIYNKSAPVNGRCSQYSNPFQLFTLKRYSQYLDSIVRYFFPSIANSYNQRASNLEYWVEKTV